MITIAFQRFDNGIFIPHVDVLRNLNRTFRRAGIDVEYSNGFNKHMSLKMTQPLPFGVEDRDCYVTADTYGNLEDIVKKFNEFCPPFLRATAAYRTEKNPSLAGVIDGSVYNVKGKLNKNQIEFINSLSSDYGIGFKKKGLIEKKPVGDLLRSISASDSGFISNLAFGNANLRIDLLCEQLNSDCGTEFRVTDVIREEQLIGNKPVRVFMEEICTEKFTLK